MRHLLLSWLVLLSSVVVGQDLPKSEITVAAGYLFEGEVYVWHPNRYGSVGESFILKVDYVGYFSDFIGLGGYVTYANPYYWAFENVSMAELGLVAKGRLRAGEKLLFKIPVYVGYRSYGGNAGTGLAINLSGVLEYQGENLRPFLDIGFLTQPAGGNDATEMTFAPMFQASVGLAFKF